MPSGKPFTKHGFHEKRQGRESERHGSEQVECSLFRPATPPVKAFKVNPNVQTVFVYYGHFLRTGQFLSVFQLSVQSMSGAVADSSPSEQPTHELVDLKDSLSKREKWFVVGLSALGGLFR